MRSRLLFLKTNVARPMAPKNRHFATKRDHCDAHMNELPIPCGDFETYYAERQGFYNKVLVGGVLWWGFSLAMMIMTGSFRLNFFPPSQPAPPSDMVTNADDKC